MPYSLTDILTLLAAILVVGEIFIIISTGHSVFVSIWRWLNARRKGHRLIKIPEELQVAIANELIKTGDELIVAHEHEWTDDTVTRFAISPERAKLTVGNTLFIQKIHREEFEISGG